MFDHMEIALHDEYGSKEYWMARRSMRFNSELYSIAENYRRTFLNSTNVNDNTERPVDWTKEKVRRLFCIIIMMNLRWIPISESTKRKRRAVFGGSS